MDKILPKKSQISSAIAIAIIVGGYAVERIISIASTPSETMVIIMAMVYTLLLGVVYFIVSRSKDYVAGLLASLLGYKMMPPQISALAQNPDANLLYYIVSRAGVVLFVLLVIKFYAMQEKPRAIKPLPILAIMTFIPFATEISDKVGRYMLFQTGSMLYPYFIGFAGYGLATVIILAVAYKSNYESMAFTALFEYLALAINILRRGTVVAVNLVAGNHVSKSYYVWIALYIGLIVLAFVLKKMKKDAKTA